MRERFENIKNNRETRKNLIALKADLKQEAQVKELRKLFEEEPETLLEQLDSEDAKVRKNAALILGYVGTDACKRALLDAYGREPQRFIKSAYLTALKACDCGDCLEYFEERRGDLLSQERTPENEKHIREELEALRTLILKYKPPVRHRFSGYQEPADVILITHRSYREVTAEQLSGNKTVLLGAGVRVEGAEPGELLKIRTYKELLFCLDCENSLKPDQIAAALADSNLLSLLERLHEGTAPFCFRIECKSRMPLDKRSVFTKKLAAALEERTKGRLMNTTSCYEAELRLVETKDGGFYPLLKLYTLPDRRFSYRKNSIAASIQPSLAALLMELARPYLKEEAQVLDPFCGVGTMLLERNYLLHADTMYGVDSFRPAIEGARENAEIARVPVHYVNRDFFDFTHAYLFDEIVTNLPAGSKTKTAHEMDFLYGKFFEKAGTVLKPGGCMILYSHDRGFVKKQLRLHKEMHLLQEWPVNEREDTWLFAVRTAE